MLEGCSLVIRCMIVCLNGTDVKIAAFLGSVQKFIFIIWKGRMRLPIIYHYTHSFYIYLGFYIAQRTHTHRGLYFWEELPIYLLIPIWGSHKEWMLVSVYPIRSGKIPSENSAIPLDLEKVAFCHWRTASIWDLNCPDLVGFLKAFKNLVLPSGSKVRMIMESSVLLLYVCLCFSCLSNVN